MSFFNYTLVEMITNRFGTRRDKQRLTQYKKDFDEYAQRLVFECPAEVGYQVKGDSTIHVKLDQSYDNCTFNQLEVFRTTLCEVLKVRSLELYRVERGCYELKFQTRRHIKDRIFPLSSDQQTELGNLGVVWIQCDEYEYHTELRKNIEHNDDKSDDSQSDDEDGAQGTELRRRNYTPQRTKYAPSISDSGFSEADTKSKSEKSEFSEMQDFLLDDPVDPKPMAYSELFSTHLNIAAFNGFLSIVRNCIEVLKQDPFQVSNTRDTALHVAAQGGHLSIVKYLVEHCMKGEVTPAIHNNAGKIPLHIAAQNGHLPVVQYFVEECQIDPLCPDKEQMTPLLEACRNGDSQLVSYLISEAEKHQTIDTVLISSVANKGNGALHFAASSGNCVLVQLLIDKYKMSPNISGQLGATPFLVASQAGQIGVICYLSSLESCDIHCTTQGTKFNAVHFAASKGHFEVIKYLSCELKLNPYQKDLVGRTALHIAALHGFIDIVRWFIEENNVHPEVQDNKGQTPLHNASSQGHLLTVKYFVEECKCNVLLTNNKRETPLHVAARNGFINIVQYYTLEQNVDPLCSGINYNTPLHVAIYHDQQHVVMFYIRNYLHKFAAVEQLGHKLFRYSVIKGHLDIVKVLIRKLKWAQKKKGFHQNRLLNFAIYFDRVNILRYLICVKKWEYCPPPDENNLFHAAARIGQLNVVKFFVEELKYDPGTQNPFGSTPLHEACFYGATDVIKYLYKNTKLDNSFVDKELMTPLHYAASFNQLEAVECLITDFKCDPNCIDIKRNTPLHHATGKGHFEIVKFFLSNLGLSPDTVNADQQTLMHIACTEGHTKIIQYLLEKYPPSFSIDKHRRTPLFYMAQMGYLDSLKTAINKNPLFDKMHKDVNGFMLLHYAAMYGQLNIIIHLIEELSFDPNLCNESGYTLLHIACGFGYKNVSEYLVFTHQCKMVPTIAHGAYPIHLAASCGQLEVFKWLVCDLKVDPLCRDSDGETPLHSAANSFHINVIKFCLETLNVNPSVTDYKGYNLLHCASWLESDVVKNQQGGSAIMNADPTEFILTERIAKLLPQKKSNHHVQKETQLKLVKLLVQYGCNPASKDMHSIAPLHLASYSGFVEAVEIFLISLRSQNILVCKIRSQDGMTPLHYACVTGQLLVVDMLVPDSSNLWVDVPFDKVLRSPLHIAVKYGHLDVVQLLVDRKSHIPFSKDELELTPLHYAIIGGHFEIVKFLFTRLNIKFNFKEQVNKNLLQLAFISKNENIVKFLIEKYKATIDPLSTLRIAIEKGSLELIKSITSIWKFRKIISSQYAISALGCAVLRGDVKIFTFLVEKLKLNPSLKGEGKINSLHNACKLGHTSIVEYILSLPNYDVHTKSADGSTALHYASESGVLEIVQMLLKKNFKILQFQVEGTTSLHYAVINGHLPLVKLYVEKYKCSPNILQKDTNWTPLHFAANMGYLNIVKYLVSNRETHISARESFSGASPLHLACSWEYHLDMVKYLMKVYERRKLPYPLDYGGKTPLHYAAQGGDLSIVKHLVLEMGCDPMCTDNFYGNTPLHLAASKGHSDVVAFYVQEVYVHSQFKLNNYGQSSLGLWKHGMTRKFEFGYKNRELHEAAEEGDMNQIFRYIKYKNCNQRDKLNRTPLHYAAMFGKQSVLSKLLRSEADPLAKDVFNNLPLHYAAALGHAQAVELLLGYCSGSAAVSRGTLNMTPIDMALLSRHMDVLDILNAG